MPPENSAVNGKEQTADGETDLGTDGRDDGVHMLDSTDGERNDR
jgi:hypothetical protein